MNPMYAALHLANILSRLWARHPQMFDHFSKTTRREIIEALRSFEDAQGRQIVDKEQYGE